LKAIDSFFGEVFSLQAIVFLGAIKSFKIFKMPLLPVSVQVWFQCFF